MKQMRMVYPKHGRIELTLSLTEYGKLCRLAERAELAPTETLRLLVKKTSVDIAAQWTRTQRRRA